MIRLADPRRRLAVRAVVWAAVAAATLALGLPAGAQGGAALASAEAWYLHLPGDGASPGPGEPPPANPLCDLAPDLPGCAPAAAPVERTSPYPAGTLHVSVVGGARDTTTFLELRDPLGPPGQVVGGTLTLPVAADAGSAAPETARFQACAITGAVADGVEAGDPATAPIVDCTASSPAVYTAPPEAPAPDPAEPAVPAAPEGTFTIDLAPLAARWAAAPPAVALVPTDDALAEGDTWHVAVDGRDREVEDHRPATVVLQVQPADDDGAGDGGGGTTAPPPATGGSGTASPARPRPVAPAPAPVRPATPGSAAAPAIGSGPAPVVPAPQVATGDPLGTAVEAGGIPSPAVVAPLGSAVGAVYPATYFTPLVAMVLGGLAASSLVRPMRLPAPVEGRGAITP